MMEEFDLNRGSFTLPGEAGYEELTLHLAEKWGADVIRDSDGTSLSPEILQAGYGIYSTVCVIRDHNAWIREHPTCRQQSFLMAGPVTAESEELRIDLLEQFFREQFEVNDSPESMAYWQVFDRTTEEEVPVEQWSYDRETGSVCIKGCTPWHQYSVSFLAYRIWEEISMYNHTTNSWDKEHLMQLDPRYPEAAEYLRRWMRSWCEAHPQTTVVRFTSLFYNFVWIWGAEEIFRNLYTDWGSYDFTVSPLALRLFEQEYGYALCAEDFIHQGKLQVTHMPPTDHKKDWMAFVHRFVTGFAHELVGIVHEFGKKAYVFYDDSWVGMEPYGRHFKDIGFDGLIKCVFSGFEVRLCAGVPNVTHELRLHPYLFPVGLEGKPSFAPGGDPAAETLRYWIHIRRALLQQCVDRLGLGGYLHLTIGFDDFNDTIWDMLREFRLIKKLHAEGGPLKLRSRVAVLHTWGRLRSWTLSGHFHETYRHALIHLNEALSGLPVDVDFISFDDVKRVDLSKYQLIINAGREGDAWSGGSAWQDTEVVSRLTAWAAEGGILLGVGEPSATEGYTYRFRMAPVLGVDLDRGERICHGKRPFTEKPDDRMKAFTDRLDWEGKPELYLTDASTEVYKAKDGRIVFSEHPFGKGCGIYLSDFSWSPEGISLLRALLQEAECRRFGKVDMPESGNPCTEAVYYPASHCMAVSNLTEQAQRTVVRYGGKSKEIELKPSDCRYIEW
ncbi:MAG: 1,3-beta-galactosyl-N-acetylhexosamine phosphorylase [Firmicutes bacterium]|nr:1,3-beta-galactosyl-N-acetylhexosamine phosphorylase [Bacillota bacterium]